jgi:hypothetical protein
MQYTARSAKGDFGGANFTFNGSETGSDIADPLIGPPQQHGGVSSQRPGQQSTGLVYPCEPLVEEAGDAPFGQYWASSPPPLFNEPFLTRADGALAQPCCTQKICRMANEIETMRIRNPFSGTP